MEDHITIRPALAEQFGAALESMRIILLSAPCGFGKTVTAEKLLSGRRVFRTDAAVSPLSLPAPDDRWDVLLLDQLQYLKDVSDQQALCELIRSHPNRRFVMMTRGVAPGWLIPFQVAGLMTTFSVRDLMLDRDTTARLMESFGLTVSELDLTAIHRETYGYPVAIIIAAQQILSFGQYGPEVDTAVRHALFQYFDEVVYRRFPLPMRRFLLELSPFPSFDAEQARMVSVENNAGELLRTLQEDTTMMLFDDLERCHFWEVFQQFLQWELEREYTLEQQKALYIRGGLYYELHEDYSSALECYAKGGDQKKISDLLEKNAQNHPGAGHYLEMSHYYHLLPEQEIRSSPALMQGMSILCAMEMDYTASEHWYALLKEFLQQCSTSDAAYKDARSRLAWLDISLPQRSVEELPSKFLSLFQLMTNKEVKLPTFSVTSMLPSIMNGGKDFSAWSKRDDLLYNTLRHAVTAALGRDGVAMPECAIAESKFEKGEDITNRMLALMSRLSEI